jgi:hypothetical protein
VIHHVGAAQLVELVQVPAVEDSVEPFHDRLVGLATDVPPPVFRRWRRRFPSLTRAKRLAAFARIARGVFGTGRDLELRSLLTARIEGMEM